MKQSKFSLADLLTLIAALAYGFVCFLGANFFTLGDITQSIILATIIVVLLSGTALGAKLLKRTSRHFKTCFIWEMILLVIFTCLTVFFSYSPFPHYFVVSSQKADIQDKIITSITQAENMFTEYEHYAENRENLYKSKLRSVVAAKNIDPSEYANYGFEENGVADATQIENKMFMVHADLFPTNYEETKQVGTNWLIDARKITNWQWIWDSIIILNIVNEVEIKSNDWLTTLINLSTIRENGEQAEDFAVSLLFDNVKKHFTTLDNPTALSIGLALIAYLLMLLSWFITTRHTKFPGLKVIFGARNKTTHTGRTILTQ